FVHFEIVNIAASINANIFLIYLIIYRSSREIGVYHYLLLAFALNDIYFPIIHFLTMPVICSYKDAFIMFAHGFLTSRLSICLFGATFSQTMPLLAHLFIYRLVATKWLEHLFHSLYRKSCMVGAFPLEIENPRDFRFLHCFFNGYDEESGEYMQPFLDENFNREGKEFIGAVYYSIDGKFRMSAFLTTMGFNAIMVVCISIILFCSFSIVAHLRSQNVKWSGKTKRMIIPMVFVYFPCAGIINLPIFGFRMSVFPNLVSASLTIFPLIDAFIVMFGVKSYR
ncbi:hypothetical protein PENTCL1PPCAC_19692, partial [Pristionchus entomophagus]